MIDKQIFVFRTGSLGDSVVALPAIRTIYEHYGRKLYLITNKPRNNELSSWEVYKHTDYFKDYFEFENSISFLFAMKNWIRNKKGKKILFYLVDKSSWKRNYRNFFIFKILGINEIIGIKENTGDYIERDKDGNLRVVESEYVRLEKIVRNYLKLENPSIKPRFDFFKFSKGFVSESHKKFPFLKEKFIVLGIGGKTKIQRWSEDKYISILNKIQNDIGIIILGGKGDKDRAEYIKNNVNSKKVVNLCGKTDILGSAYILSKAKFYLGNDTGTAHLASVAGCKCIVITSGRDNPGRWDPYGYGHKVIRKRVECEGCWLHTDNCSNNIKCMDIDVDIVMTNILHLLER